MADLFRKQAKKYAETRPSYPPELFRFIASKTAQHRLAWDVATGSGQAAVSLAENYENVIATDVSPEQLAFATKLPNIRYQHTAPTLSIQELERDVAPESSVDLVTIAQALHWFDLPNFYEQVNHVLRKPGGILAAWCYTEPMVSEPVDRVFWSLYTGSKPFWAPQREIVDDEFRSIEFPFDPVEGEEHTGPFEFVAERWMDLETYFTYIRSWSAYQTAKGTGVELLTETVVNEFEVAWGNGGKEVKVVRYPVHLRIGRVRE